MKPKADTWGELQWPRPETIPQTLPDREDREEPVLYGPRGEPILVRRPVPFGFRPPERTR